MENLNVVILKQYYKKANDTEIKYSYSVKLETMGGYIFLKPSKTSYGQLCRLAEQHPEIVRETNTQNDPRIIE